MAHPGYYDNKAEILSRLKKIEVQVRGIQKMVDQEAYCIDILTQISAINKSLESVGLKLLEEHLNHCVKQTLEQKGKDLDKTLKELIDTVSRLVK